MSSHIVTKYQLNCIYSHKELSHFVKSSLKNQRAGIIIVSTFSFKTAHKVNQGKQKLRD